MDAIWYIYIDRMDEDMISISEREFRTLADYMKRQYGIDLPPYKKNLVQGRLYGVLNDKNFRSFEELYNYVISDPSGEAAVLLVNKLTTNHTFFLREAQHFDYFKSHVLPYIVSLEKRTKDVRLWSAGCSSGEEPYTLQMILSEYFGTEKMFWDTSILATDISTKALQKALEGTYSDEEIEMIPPIWKKKYFKSIGESKNKIIDKIKKDVVFRRFNLVSADFPFRKKFHGIFCRNVMIYFDRETKKRLVDKFYELTEPGGYLFIGHSESLERSETKYKYIMPAVYRKE